MSACPSCHSNDISRSKKRKPTDVFMRWMGKVAYRCRDCQRRFYVDIDVHKRLKKIRAWEKRSTDRETVPPKRRQQPEADPLEGYEADFEE